MKTAKNTFKLVLMLSVALITLTTITSGVHAEKIKIEKADDLPTHSYTIEIKAVEYLDNETALKELMALVKADLEEDLEKYDIQDKTTLKGYFSNLGTIALIEGRYDDYLGFLQKRNDLEDKEAVKLTRGLFTRAYIKALKSGSENLADAFRDEYAKLVAPLPYDKVGSDLEAAKGSAEIFSKNLIIGIINERTQPIIDKGDGVVSKDIANSLIGRYFTVHYYLLYKDIMAEVLTEYLEEHKVVKPDIWEALEVTLTKKDKGKPVVIGIWDAGVDQEVFKGIRYVNKKEIPGNGLDDDKNGFVDDAYGIAYDLYSDKTPDLLYPAGEVADRPRLQAMMKGMMDLNSNVDSQEATDLKKMLSTLDPSEVKPFIEDIGKYGNHCHGTHVAGIAARGNPYIRIMAARLTFDHRMTPMAPTVEWAKKTSDMMVETVQYFKDNGVRAVNMSWIYTLDEIEAALEANGVGETPEARKELTREIFDIIKEGLYAAIEGAPEILFIGGAGNADNDLAFEEFIPCSFQLPNIMSIGAVDQAGDETDFTSFGKVDAYANGFEVLSYVPGGDQIKLSGTSMAAPNTTNLAAKLFAMKPDLTTAQARKLIEKACDENKAGDRVIKLINPKKSFEMLKKM